MVSSRETKSGTCRPPKLFERVKIERKAEIYESLIHTVTVIFRCSTMCAPTHNSRAIHKDILKRLKLQFVNRFHGGPSPSPWKYPGVVDEGSQN
jgi:hypothetical protein